jgi:DNA-binding transcriptional MerR regulator
MSAEEKNSKFYTIGEISRIYGVTHRGLRFYEKRGLIAPIRKGCSRFYDAASVAQLQMILKGKLLGFTLAEIAELTDRDDEQAQASGELPLDEESLLAQMRFLKERRAELDQMIDELHAAHDRVLAGARARK